MEEPPMTCFSLSQRTAFASKSCADFLPFIQTLPERFERGEGKVIYKGRNELRLMRYLDTNLIVKSFQVPNLINRIAYGFLRSSKAERSCRYAERLLQMGIGTPQPVGYFTERRGGLFRRSYYVSYQSRCPYTFADLLKQPFPAEEKILQAIARTTAQLHEQGWLHKDYSRGNILFGWTSDGVQVEIIDLNRIRFKQVGWEEGCRNFERLPLSPHMLTILTTEYAKARHFDIERCLHWMKKHHQQIIPAS